MNNFWKKIISFVVSTVMFMSIGIPTSALAYSGQISPSVVYEQQADIKSIEVLPLSASSSIDNWAAETNSDESNPTILTSNFSQNKGITGLVTFGFSSATDTSITVTVLNASTSSVRTSNLKVKISGDNQISSYKIGKTVWPIGLTRVTIDADQKSCIENLTLTGSVAPSEGMFEVFNDITAKRSLKSSIVNQWVSGSFSTKEACINYHYNQHKEDRYIPTANTIGKYCLDANELLKYVKDNKTPGKETKPGATPNTYKYMVGKKYIMAVGSAEKATGPIVSYGGN